MGLVAKAFQDIITFSRSTQTGTYVNSNGYITNSSVLNYLTYSNQPENAAWTKSNSFVQTNLATNSQDFDLWSLGAGVSVAANSTIAPDGTLTADRITFTAGGAAEFVRRTATLTVGTIYTVSVYAQAAVGTPNFVFDVGNTTVSTAQTPTSVWQRFTFTFTFSGANQWVDLEASAAGTIAFYGAQIVQGSVPGDYRATTSAALPCLYADYNGALRARKLCEDATASQHSVQCPVAMVSGQQYTLSVYMKAGERSYGYLQINDNVSRAAWTSFNLVNGTVVVAPTAITGSFAGMTSSATLIGNGVYRVQFTVTAGTSSTGSFYVAISNDGVTRVYTGDGSSGIYIADAQLNDGSAATSYYETTTYPYYAPRFDYDPVTLAAKGLLVEEQRANLLLQSNDFQTSWSVTNITRTLNSILSPSGNVDGVKIAATATATTALYQQANVAATSATFSVYAKQGTGATTANNFIIRNITTLTNLIAGTLNYSTGVFTYSVGSTGVVVSNAGNGWWRVQISATTGITSGDLIAGYVGFSGGGFTAGDFLYAYQAQLEAGAFATSVIPTVASQVTRAADVASVNTLSPWYNSVAGTLYAEFQTAPVGTAAQYFAEIDSGSANNAIWIARDSGGNGVGGITTGGVSQAGLGLSTLANSTVGKIALAYAANDFAASKNGGAAVTDAAGTVPTALTILRIGANELGGVNSNFVNGHLRRITYYPRRLTNAELQTLTTL